MRNIIVDVLNDCANIEIYLLKGINEGDTFLFPLGKDKNEIFKIYKDNLKYFAGSKEVVDYDYETTDKDAIQKIDIKDVSEWEKYQKNIDVYDGVTNNVPKIDKSNFCDDYKLIVAKCSDDKGKKIYLITKFSKPKNTYINKLNYVFEAGTFKKMEEPTISINCDISCVYYNNDMYIISESKFNSIFNFYKKIIDKVNDNISEVDNWKFLSDIEEVKQDIQKNIRNRRRFIKILDSENLEALKAKSRTELKELILQYDILKDKLQFKSDGTIVYNKDSLKTILDLLTNKIFISVLTGKLQGD